MKTPRKSSKLFTRAVDVMPGGVSSPVRAFKAVGGSPRFIAQSVGVADHRRRWQQLHRLRDVVGSDDPRTRAFWSDARAGEAGTARYELRRAESTRGGAGRAGAHAGAVDGAHQVRELGNRSHNERGPRRARGHAAREDHQVRGLLPRARRRFSRAGGLRRLDLWDAHESRRAGGRRRTDADRHVQRSGVS